jgi:hypothetical protein
MQPKVFAQNVAAQSYLALLRSVGMPKIRLHDLHDTCATLLLIQGAHLKDVHRGYIGISR